MRHSYFRVLRFLFRAPVALIFVSVAILFKRPAVRPELLRDLAARIDSLSVELRELRTQQEQFQVAAVPGGGGGSTATPAAGMDDVQPVLSSSRAPDDWRFCVVRGEPCVVIREKYLLRIGHMSSYGIVQAITPECVVTDRVLLVFGGSANG